MPTHEFKITIVDVREDGLLVGEDIEYVLIQAGIPPEFVAIRERDAWIDIITGIELE